MASPISPSYTPSQRAPNFLKGHALLAAAMVLWVPAVGFGIHTALRYENTPGQRVSPPSHWPLGTSVQSGQGKATLLVFAHPHCPCSRATVGELAWIMSRSQQTFDAQVLFYSPGSKPDSWTKTALWRDAEAIPGVKPRADLNGREALRFGASTSGQTLLYDRSGRLLFSGGITRARGHSGANAGREAVLARLQGKSSQIQTTPAFGCSLTGGA